MGPRQQIATVAPTRPEDEEIIIEVPVEKSSVRAFFKNDLILALARVISCISLNFSLDVLKEVEAPVEIEGEENEPSQEYLDAVSAREAEYEKVNSSPLVIAAAKFMEDNDNRETLIVSLVKECGLLLKIDDKDMESSFNLVIGILKLVETETTFDELVTIVKDVLCSDDIKYSQIKLKILSNLYNSLDLNSKHRFTLYLAIISLATKSDDLELVIPTFAYLNAWIKEWSLDVSEIRKLYDTISTSLYKSHKRESYEYLIKYLSTFESNSDLAPAKPYAIKAIKQGISIPEVLNFEPLFTLKAVQSLKTQADAKTYIQLLSIFINDNLDAYDKWSASQKEWMKKEGLSDEENKRKMRLLTLSALAAENTDGEVSYDKIAKALKVPSEDVEMWVIDGIRAELIEAKMNQLKMTVVISRATHRFFTATQWLQLAQRLGSWRDNLDSMLQVIANAKLLGDQDVVVPEAGN